MGFKIGKTKAKEYEYYKPKDYYELKEIITKRRHDDPDLDLTDIDVSKIHHLEELFCDLNPYTINISNWDLTNCESISRIFAGCRNLEYVNMKDVDTSNINNMNNMCYNCSSLKKIDGIENFNISNLRSAGQLLYGCESLVELNLSKWKPKKLTSTYYMFAFCKNLKTVGDISKWDMSTVWNLDYMFAYCNNLEFTGDLNKWNIDIDNYKLKAGCMFRNCKCWEKNKPEWFLKKYK